ncbi:DUF4013 domain-containing protein [Halorarius halobius]|uniref:DUF4013 domain-containing protein n=1 Tax=Halorarius halobius TaxID=2962671 RepID=UPI0020CE862D|nr:DUF4013 domain-containing protein [Halorarius halobius]
MLEDAINYPRESDDAVRNVVVGSLLSLFSVLILPAFLLLGYFLRVIRASMDGEPVPGFDEWGELFVEGLKAFVVSLVVFLVPMVLFGVSVGSALAAALAGDVDAVRATVFAGAVLGVLAASLLSLVALYLLPAMLALLARSGRVGAAFAWRDLRGILFHGSYAAAWALALGVLLVVGVATGLVAAVPLVGWLLAVPVNFYGLVVAYSLYGRGVAAASDADSGPESPEGRPAV